MNIALLHYSVPPIVGGVESVIAHHARLMDAAGHSVRLIAARGESLSGAIPLTIIPLADSRHDQIARMKVHLDQGQIPADFDALRDELGRQLLNSLTGVDVLIAHNVCSLNKNLALTAALHHLHASKKLPRLILWHHDLAWTTPRYLPEMHEGYPWDLLKTDWGNTTHAVVSNQRRDELADLMSLDPESIRIVPNGVDVSRFYKLESTTEALLEKMNLLDAAPILLLPVRVTPRKNIELALHTMVELKKRLARAALVVTGPLGPHNVNNIKYFEMLSALRGELGLEGSVHFLAELAESFLPDEVIADFFRLADALFFPSREEGFGIPILEAGISSMPVFCSNIRVLRELGDELVWYFSPDEDPKEIAKMMGEHFSKDQVYGLRARVRTHYTWERVYKTKVEPLL